MKHIPDYIIEQHRDNFLKRFDIHEQKTFDGLFDDGPPVDFTHNLYEVHKRMLRTIYDQPFLNQTELFAAFGGSDAEAGIIRDWLFKEGYLVKEKARMSKRGPKGTLHNLTEKAGKVLGVTLPGITEGKKRHQFYGVTTKDYHELEGYRVEREAPVNIPGSNQRMDVFAEKDGEGLAIEITLSDRNLFENIDKCFSDPRVTKVIIVAETKTELTKFKKKVQARNIDYRGPVEFKTIGDYFAK